MTCDVQFKLCKHCGNLVGTIFDSGVPIICCGEEMEVLTVNTVDASKEKHVPAPTVSGDEVTVHIGAAPHPMVPEHYIEWVYLKTDRGGHRKCLKPGEEPVVQFALKDETPLEAYAYCNLHGLWMAKV